MFDLSQASIFIAFDSKIVTTYVLCRFSVKGKHVLKIGETKLNPNQQPLMLYAGDMVLHIDGGQYATQTLSTHIITPGLSQSTSLKLMLNLKNYAEAFKICEKIDLKASWLEFGEQAIADLEPEIGNINNCIITVF